MVKSSIIFFPLAFFDIAKKLGLVSMRGPMRCTAQSAYIITTGMGIEITMRCTALIDSDYLVE